MIDLLASRRDPQPGWLVLLPPSSAIPPSTPKAVTTTVREHFIHDAITSIRLPNGRDQATEDAEEGSGIEKAPARLPSRAVQVRVQVTLLVLNRVAFLRPPQRS